MAKTKGKEKKKESKKKKGSKKRPKPKKAQRVQQDTDFEGSRALFVGESTKSISLAL